MALVTTLFDRLFFGGETPNFSPQVIYDMLLSSKRMQGSQGRSPVATALPTETTEREDERGFAAILCVPLACTDTEENDPGLPASSVRDLFGVPTSDVLRAPL